MDTYQALTIGQMHGLARVMVKVAMVTGWKSRILGYISSGERVWVKEIGNNSYTTDYICFYEQIKETKNITSIK